MLAVGMDILIQYAGDSRRRPFHCGRVHSREDDRYTLELDSKSRAPAAGHEVMIHFTAGRRFLKQSGCIETVLAVDPQPRIVVRLIGRPVTAESRQCYRVCTALGDEFATVNGELCRLMDISATGFAFVTTRRYEVNQRLDAELNDAGESFRGEVVIQNRRDLGKGRFRYGVHCVDDHRIGDLHKGAQRLFMAMQRRQLRRMAAKGV